MKKYILFFMNRQILILSRRFERAKYACWISSNYTIGRNILCDYCIGTNEAIVSHRDTRHYHTIFAHPKQDISFVFNHFMALGDFARPLDFSLLTVPQIISLAVVMLFAVIGIVHYIRKYHDDKIRIRLIYGIFIWTDLATALFLVLQPQHYDHLIRMMVINTAPLIGHFLALTRTRWTNMAFFAIVAIVLITTGINLWM